MTDLLTPELPTADNDGDIALGHYAQRAYLEYALSVVKGRALPDVCDGQKPVQRRILYSMSRMGLGYSGPNNNTGAKPVKCARVVGDVLGRYHPHGDSAAYEALVRMAQDFAQRYPLIDGQGNFGSRDGDGAAAMRYTEARLAKITTLLLDEIDEGTVDFQPNYDGSTEEPKQLPARLPFALLNGASGIAVGMATEIPSHNLREVADACVALIKTPKLSDEELLQILPAPDYPGGGQIISSASDIADAYRTGRGSLKVRARWVIEDLARGQWQLVVNELPPGVSSQKVLEEIEELTNPKVKTGKKALSAEQTQLKATILAVLDVVRDESSKDAPVRLVFEPKTRTIEQQELITTLLAHTSLETSSSINLTMVGIDGRPVPKSLREMLTEWIEFRSATILRRSQHRLNKVLDRIHILEGRQLVLLNIDEVIAIIRQSDEPKQALMERFKLSERQAEDILEIRLRQLARLEAIKIEQELKELRDEQAKLEDIVGNPSALRRLMVKEIEADAKTFADPRRTLIQEEKKAVAEVKVVDEPVTVVVSEKGWVRARTGHGHEASAFAFKSGDGLYGTFECRTVDTFIAFGSNGRIYSVPVAALPGARGDGQPVTTLVDLESGTQLLHYVAGPAGATYLLSSSGGYGFMANIEHMISRNKGGKAFITVGEGETVCRPSPASGGSGAQPVAAATHVACASTGGRFLTFELSELKAMEKGGRGLMLIDLEAKDTLAGAAAYTRSVRIEGIGRGGKVREETLEIRSLNNAKAARAKKGKVADLGFKPNAVVRVE
ncbi:MAG: DNA topoisomerase IV subunit A [Burkholderiales bacterium 35-55-47]|jgi:topoisomerase-4 subunit A|uniref:DNA topoisomerase IV subunit A n=1 Tax=Limnohabitans sp. TaxID=1907725 RepID=UPI000BD179D1|nr:DNA topoisomerase IV subunit A [Limnohabitans sp.]OYY19704.1 MAG: DNA topoisomerase IV subunit A [Burkholderiales bacterium 35-55-47]OYZ74686.1 MAG: DNA topoisomerase IV subunit A [Burkholderiales bacterium 24-55-52]OZB01425.1 MAG: DNA topoisomerase IV subunit A [Burkholderiales bacterium 39-55-53]HQR85897.1 DNA topoisomerase IV subunit A [Limnohabitans sp.]HQS26187.1 DNA topoisomerase IV subunit A [Limnohabitans sp.]